MSIIKVDRMKDVFKALERTVQTRVLVGIPDSTAERKEGEEADSGFNNAAIGYVQETGDPQRNLPARPFLVPGVKAAEDAIAKHLKRAADFALDGKPDEAEQAMQAAGLVGQNSVRATINAGVEPALSDATLAARARRGRKGAKAEMARREAGEAPGMVDAKPLIDTAQLRNAVTFVVRKK